MLNQEDKQIAGESIRFIAVLGMVALVLWLALSPLEMTLRETEAQWVRVGLEWMGTHTSNVAGTISGTENASQFLVEGKRIEISPLCAGLVETILLVAAMAATPGIALRKKVIGVVVGVVLLQLFNVLRMIVSIQQLVHTSLEWAEFTHGVLFRVVLLVGFALIYAAWLHSSRIKGWASRKGLV